MMGGRIVTRARALRGKRKVNSRKLVIGQNIYAFRMGVTL